MPDPSPDDAAPWHRRFGAECNNAAWELVDRAGPDEAELDEAARERCLRLAFAAWHHWDAVGTDLHRARADQLLAWALALAGHSADALRVAGRAVDAVAAAGDAASDWDRAFGHATAAFAATAASEASGGEAHRRQAEELAGRLGDEERGALGGYLARGSGG